MKAIRVDDVPVIEPRRVTKFLEEKIGAKNVMIHWMEKPAGFNSGPHTREVEEIIYILSGKCAISTEKERYEATAGTIIYIPPGEKHQHENIGTGETFSQLVIFAPPYARAHPFM